MSNVVPPLVKFVRDRQLERERWRKEKSDERKKKELDKRRQREEESRRRKERQAHAVDDEPREKRGNRRGQQQATNKNAKGANRKYDDVKKEQKAVPAIKVRARDPYFGSKFHDSLQLVQSSARELLLDSFEVPAKCTRHSL
jgi:hypothetical protein